MIRGFLVLFMCTVIVSAQEWERFTTKNSGLPSDLVYGIAVGPDSTMWFATAHGVASFKAGTWNLFDTATTPLPDPYVTAIAVDPLNAVWIGTGYEGVARYWNGNWTVYSKENSAFPHNTVFDITIGPDGTPWCATDSGVVNISDGTIRNLASGMFEPRSRSVGFARDGVLWMGTYDPMDFKGYVEYFTADTFAYTVLSRHELISTYVTEIAAVSDSEVYVATGDGLARIVRGEWTVFRQQNSPLPASGVAALALSGDTVLIGTASGVAELVRGSWRVWTPTSNGLPNDVVTDIAVDPFRRRWYATASSGVVLHQPPTGTLDIPRPSGTMPAGFSLQNYPNPFNPATTISYQLPVPGMTTLKVYDALGREAAVLVNEPQEAGAYSVRFNASHLSSGIYHYSLRSGSVLQTRSMLLLK